jgi:hypothetical protein
MVGRGRLEKVIPLSTEVFLSFCLSICPSFCLVSGCVVYTLFEFCRVCSFFIVIVLRVDGAFGGLLGVVMLLFSGHWV